MGKRSFRGRYLLGWVIGALVLASAPAFAQCSDGTVELRGDWGRAQFNVEIADDPAERSLGLMNRSSMARSHGMLFIYERPQHARFWMKNTLIPLDMIFLDAQGRVTRVHENAVPLDETPIDGGAGVRAVLEINGGLARMIGIAPGSLLRAPALGPDIAWPCDAP